jgi:hemolysin-activating ACP:hemolysin acyltransferase
MHWYLVQAQDGRLKVTHILTDTLFLLAQLTSYQLNALVKTIANTIIPNVWTDVVFLYSMPNEKPRSMLQVFILWVGLDIKFKPTVRDNDGNF